MFCYFIEIASSGNHLNQSKLNIVIKITLQTVYMVLSQYLSIIGLQVSIFLKTQQLLIKIKMRGTKIPHILRNSYDRSITLTYNNPKYSLIWLHGLGDQAQSFVPYFSHLQSPLFQHCRIKLLQAPRRFLTIQNQQTNSWYDIKTLQRFSTPQQESYDLSQLQNSTNLVASHVKQEEEYWKKQSKNSKIPEQHRIFLGGFSQGGVVALNYALSAQKIPAGALSVGGYLLKHTKTQNLGKIPLLLLHGDQDTVIYETQAKDSYSSLLKSEAMTEYSVLNGLGHEMNLQHLKIMKKWFEESFSFIEKHYQQ